MYAEPCIRVTVPICNNSNAISDGRLNESKTRLAHLHRSDGVPEVSSMISSEVVFETTGVDRRSLDKSWIFLALIFKTFISKRSSRRCESGSVRFR